MSRYLIIALVSAAFMTAGCGNGGDENKIEASGNIETVSITISAKTAGEVKEIRVDEGGIVKKGDTLMIIDNENLQIQLKQAAAGRMASEAQLEMLRKGSRSEDRKSAEMTAYQAEISFNQAKSDFERMDNLYRSKSITLKQYEDAKYRLELTESQYKAASENLSKIKNIARPEELKQMEAKLNQMIAAEELLKKSINDSYILSPADGMISGKYFEVGEYVTPMASLMKISDIKRANLYIYVSEEDLGRIMPGQEAEVFTDSYKDKSYKGKIVYISPEAEFTPKNIQTKDERTKLVYEVKIEIPNQNYELKAGMPADAVINISSGK